MHLHTRMHGQAKAGSRQGGLVLTLCARPEAAQNPEQGGLAGARVAGDEQALPLGDLQAQILD